MRFDEFPKYKYFKAGNSFTAEHDGYFHIKLTGKKEELAACYWYGAFSADAAEKNTGSPEVYTESFEMSPEGFQKAMAWLEEQFQNRRLMRRQNLFSYAFIDSDEPPAAPER